MIKKLMILLVESVIKNLKKDGYYCDDVKHDHNFKKETMVGLNSVSVRIIPDRACYCGKYPNFYSYTDADGKRVHNTIKGNV